MDQEGGQEQLSFLIEGYDGDSAFWEHCTNGHSLVSLQIGRPSGKLCRLTAF